MTVRRTFVVCVAFACASPSLSVLQAQQLVLTPAAQKEQQKRANAAVEQTARFVTTSIRSITYQKLKPNEEQALLEEVAAGLRHLSEDEMRAILEHLEKAASAIDEATADSEQQQAVAKHKAVVSSLRGMLFKLDLLRSLEEAAKRFRDQSAREFVLHQRALELHERPNHPGYGSRESRFGARTAEALLKESIEQQADAQAELKLELVNLIQQLNKLHPKLNAEQKERLKKHDVLGRAGQLTVLMDHAFNHMTSRNYMGCSEVQLRVSKELQALAAALLAFPDRLAALREARLQVEQIRKNQEQLIEVAANPIIEQNPQVEAPRRLQSLLSKEEQERVAIQKLAEKQGQLEFDTRDVRKLLEPVAGHLAHQLNAAESEMRKAQEEIRHQNLNAAKNPQEAAEQKLIELRDKLDAEIAKAEDAQGDPLAATRKAIDDINRLIGDQVGTREDTKANSDRPEKLTNAEFHQEKVAMKAAELVERPLPANETAKAALAKAAETSKDALNDLKKRDAAEAMPKQLRTIKELEKARSALEEQVHEIQKRREDIAKLEKAREKLEELTRKESDLAKEAQKAADQAVNAESADRQQANKELAQQQEKLTPPTKHVEDQIRQSAPEAAKELADARKNQQEAKEQLAKNNSERGASEAKKAAEKLERAKDKLEQSLDAMKAKEAAEQAALQPNQVNPGEAADQIAKAIEEANKAADAANKAADAAERVQQTNQNSTPKTATERLADAQKALAKQAEREAPPEAARKAAEAAKSLEKGDLLQAQSQQQEALEALKASEAGQPGDAAAKLAKQQQELKNAVEALQKSAEANAAAKAALAQGEASAPKAVQPQLREARNQLDRAANELSQGNAQEASQAQAQAADQLGKALGTLNEAAKLLGEQNPAEPGTGQIAKAQPADPSNQPGQKPSPGEQPGQPDSQPPGEPTDGNGDRKQLGNAMAKAPGGKDVDGTGNFINLQKLERDKVQQSTDAAFPAEFRELIKQYNINIKKYLKPLPLTPATTPSAAQNK